MTAGRRWRTHPRRMAAAPNRREPERHPVARTRTAGPWKAGPGGCDTPARPAIVVAAGRSRWPRWRMSRSDGTALQPICAASDRCRVDMEPDQVATDRAQGVCQWVAVDFPRAGRITSVDGPPQHPFLRLVGQALAPDRARRLPEKPEAVHTPDPPLPRPARPGYRHRGPVSGCPEEMRPRPWKSCRMVALLRGCADRMSWSLPSIADGRFTRPSAAIPDLAQTTGG